jgi:peptidoglycan-N-acetylglucosamine deacetylase
VGKDFLWFRSLQLIPPLIAKRTFSGCLWEGPPDCGMLAFTFDDGPDPVATPPVLDALDKAGAKGTFFLRGDRAGVHSTIVREIVARGHAVGNHGMSHRRMVFMRYDEAAREIDLAQSAIADATGVSPRFFRPPYGQFNSAVGRAVRERGLVMTIWTVLSGDFRTTDPEPVYRTVEPFIRPGAIIVFHDTLKGSRTMLPVLIERFSARAREHAIRPAIIDDIAAACRRETSEP